MEHGMNAKAIESPSSEITGRGMCAQRKKFVGN